MDFRFYRLPKFLCCDVRYRFISLTAKVVYALLLDRTCLSAANDWHDKDGDVYVVFSNRELQELLCCGHDKVTSALKELEHVRLIRRRKLGRGLADHIYLNALSQDIWNFDTNGPGFSTSVLIPRILDCGSSALGTREISALNPENPHPDCRFSAGNDTK